MRRKRSQILAVALRHSRYLLRVFVLMAAPPTPRTCSSRFAMGDTGSASAVLSGVVGASSAETGTGTHHGEGACSREESVFFLPFRAYRRGEVLSFSLFE